MGSNRRRSVTPRNAQPTSGFWRKAMAIVSLGAAAVLGIIFSGVLDRFSGAAGIPRDIATQSVVLYWVISGLGIAIVAAWPTHRMQIVLALFSLGFTLGFFEVAARVLAIPAGFLHWDGLASRELHHAYAPHRKMYAGVYEDEPVFVITNEDGLRTAYGRDDFRGHTHRIAVLGDSFTFGFGVQQENSLPTFLQHELREAAATDDLAVLNAGIVSYAPLLEKLLFGEVVRHYEPTLVIQILDPTDIGDDFKYGQEAVVEKDKTIFPRAGPECSETGKAKYYGAVIEIISPWVAPLQVPLMYPFAVLGLRLGFEIGKNCPYDYYNFDLEVGDVVETNRYFHYRHPLALTRTYFDASFEHIVETARAVRATGADYLLVVSPRFHHWNPDESPDNWESEQYALNEPYQFEYFRYFEQARSRVDFPILDLLPAFQATDEAPLVFRDDPHWNPRGNAFAARTLAAYLIEHNLLEGK
jgi:hypothetical protein